MAYFIKKILIHFVYGRRHILMSAFMSAHFSLLFTLQQLQQLMQCLPTTILLSLSHCCLLSLIVPHFFSMQQANRSCFFFCFFVCFTSSVCRSFLASVFVFFSFATTASHFCFVCVCVFFLVFLLCAVVLSAGRGVVLLCVFSLGRSLQQEE